jgi:hypothetical protein
MGRQSELASDVGFVGMKRDPEDKTKLSRRDFVKTTAAGVGAAAVSGLVAKQVEAQARPPRWDQQADIVVVGVGAGASGLPAAWPQKSL